MTGFSFEGRTAGVLVPLFALRAAHDFGCGDLAALRHFIEWSAIHGFRVVQLLPVNETGGDHSPYNAISSTAIEPSTLDLQAIADITPAEIEAIAAAHDVAAMREGAVQWRRVKAFRREVLRRAFENFCAGPWERNDVRALEFAAFARDEAGWLEGYALFRVLMDRHGTESWDTWPEEARTFPAAETWLESLPTNARELIEHDLRFVCYVQWLAFSQWDAVRRFADEHGVALMGDVPFGVNYSSADVWAQPGLFDLRWSGGAPPEPSFDDDEFVRKWGQNWGIPLYRWPEHRAENFAWWRQRVRKIGAAFHLFRIDHVLGFYRIFGFPWRPVENAAFSPLSREEAAARCGGELPRYHAYADDSPEHCEANRRQGEELLRVLLDEMGPALVGEDLGTVPEYMRPSLLGLGIPGFKVPQWEPAADGSLVRGADYPRCTVATWATHDHAPLRVIWQRWMDIITNALTEPDRLAADRDRAWWEVRRTAAWAGFEVPHIMPFEDVHEPLLAGLFASNSALAVVMITDVLGTAHRFNVPGSVGAENWSARLTPGWHFAFAEKAHRVAELVRGSGR